MNEIQVIRRNNYQRLAREIRRYNAKIQQLQRKDYERRKRNEQK